LDFREISLDTYAQSATVRVIEGHDLVFDISREISPTQPIVSSMRNLQHLIIMRKVQGVWKVVSDNYDDYLWRLIKATGISKGELLQAMNETQGQSHSEGLTQVTNNCNLPGDESIHPYNRDGAVVYAHQWATATPPYHNPPYEDFTDIGGDCTNFVSQAIHEGGNAPMVYYNDCGNNCIGTLGWFYTDLAHRANAWNNVGAIYDFITQYWVWPIPGEDDPNGPGGPEGCEVLQYEAYEGDLIQYDWTNNGSWDHSAIIVSSIDLGQNNRYHYVASHTPDVDNYPFTSFDYPNKIYRFVHIERIDGYAKIYIPSIIGGGSGGEDQIIIPYPAPVENGGMQPLPYPEPIDTLP
jgi:hypothetical protein